MPGSLRQRTKLTPREVGARYGISTGKVLGWIKNNELRAVNIAARRGGRPRWVIDEADLLMFEASRASDGPAPARPRRRQRAGEVLEFF
jgi:hypothetical protein